MKQTNKIIIFYYLGRNEHFGFSEEGTEYTQNPERWGNVVCIC